MFDVGGTPLDAPPGPRTMLSSYYSRLNHGPQVATSTREFLDAGGVAVDERLVPAGTEDSMVPDHTLGDNGVRSEYRDIGGRRRVVVETADPPTGINSVQIWWTDAIPGDSIREMLVDVTAISTRFDESALAEVVAALTPTD